MKSKYLILLTLTFFVASFAQAQGNWEVSNQSVSPNGVVPSEGTVTVSSNFTWTSTQPFINDNHLITFYYALPKSVYVSTGTPSLVYKNTQQAVAGAVFTTNAGGWKCNLAAGTSLAAGTELLFKIENIEVRDDKAYQNQLSSSFISFMANPSFEQQADNASTATFSTAQSSPLPVGLLNFDAQLIDAKNNPKVALKWSTASEIEADYFIVQRSQNANFWIDAFTVEAKGNSNTKEDYSGIDHDPINGISYYRLKQVDVNNKFSLSDVRVINLNGKSSTNVYPNPASEIVNIQFIAEKTAQMEIKLIAMDGRVAQSLVANVESGMNTFKMEVQDLSQGIYDVSIFENGTLIDASKLIKN